MEDDFAPREKTRTLGKVLMATIATVAMAGAGLYVFIRGAAYFENGQFLLIGAFLLALVLVFVGTMRVRIPVAITGLVLGAVCLFGAYEKFAWRRTYVESGLSGKPFILDAHIRTYPPLESYLAAPYLGLPDWVRLARDCVEPLRAGLAAGEHCANLDDIRSTYHIDVKTELKAYRERMARTADQIVKGKLTKKKDYQACIARKDCAEVPLLPKDVDPDMIDPESNDHLPVRRMFWQLIDEKTLTPELCARIPLCAALTKTGALVNVEL